MSEPTEDLAEDVGDGAGYVDAATLALRLQSVVLQEVRPSRETHRDSQPVSGPQLRDVMGALVTGVSVISALHEGRDVAMTANSFTSLSLDPPLVLVCIAKKARFHEAITAGAAWGVSVLDADSAHLSTRFARPGRSYDDQLEGLTYSRGAATGVALLDSSCAKLECVPHDVFPGGDHSIVVGRVVSAERRLDSPHPLVFHHGKYRWLEQTS